MRISKLNEQLVEVSKAIDRAQKRVDTKLLFGQDDGIERFSAALADLCKAQESLARTQVMIFVEATESDLDMPTLPLFCEDEGSEEDEDGEEEST